MVRIEKFIFSLIIGGVFPLFLLLLSVILWYSFFRFSVSIYIFLIPALVASIVLYIRFVQLWKMRIYDLSRWFLIVVYILYNIGMFGLFMGFPAFNLFWGIVAGYYYGKRIKHLRLAPQVQEIQKDRVALFTAFIMFIVCIITGFIVVIDKYVGYDLQNMLGLDVVVSRPTISGITILGGVLLTVTQYFVTLITLNKIIPKVED